VALKKVVETRKKDIAFLVDVDPMFVSLVRHGANQQPFRVVKSEEKGGDSEMSMVVQSILLPQNVSLEELQSKKGLEWLADVKSEEVTQHGEYQKLIQMKEDKFDKSSLVLVKLDSTGTYALAGHLLAKEDSGSALTLGRNETEKVPQIKTSPMDAVVAEEPRPAFVLTFRDMFEKELSSFLDVVRGALTQSESAKKQRKKMVMDALDAFRNFLSISIDTLGSSKAKIDTSIAEQGNEEGGVNMFQFETEQEFTDKVTSIVTSVLEKSLKEKKKPDGEDTAATKTAVKEEKKEEKTAGAEPDDSMKQVLSKLDALSTEIEGIKEKQEKLEQQPATNPAATASDDEGLVNKTEKETKPSVFAGLLVRPKQQEQATQV